MKILMISRSAYEWDVRVRREARELSSAGHRVMFLGLPSTIQTDGSIQLIDVVARSQGDDPDHRRRSLPYRAVRWLLLPEHRALREKRFADLVLQKVRRLDLRPDVVHAHDFPALVPAAEIAAWFQCKLVYDSHEIWSGRPRRGRPEPVRRWRHLRHEASLAREADAVIMVSEHGALVMEERLGIAGVQVIRNTFPPTDTDPGPIPMGALYAGRIAPRRDLDTVFAAGCWKELGLSLHLMGEVDDIHIPSWAHTHPMGTMADVDTLLGRVGIGLVTMTNRYLNHRIALPNKLFQAIAAGVPVVAANAPQTAEVVTRHGLGALYEPGEPDSFDRAMLEVVQHYGTFTENVRRSQHLFDWQIDADRLVGLYQELERPSDDSDLRNR